MNWNEMTPEQRSELVESRLANRPPAVDWAAVRRASATRPRTEDEWDLVDAFAS